MPVELFDFAKRRCGRDLAADHVTDTRDDDDPHRGPPGIIDRQGTCQDRTHQDGDVSTSLDQSGPG